MSQSGVEFMSAPIRRTLQKPLCNVNDTWFEYFPLARPTVARRAGGLLIRILWIGRLGLTNQRSAIEAIAVGSLRDGKELLLVLGASSRLRQKVAGVTALAPAYRAAPA